MFNLEIAKEMNLAQLGKYYAEVIGYNITEDNITITANEILKIMTEYNEEIRKDNE